jgi:CRP-like cAMP-binding protein/N-acyl-L-homoserine lactone synthetase
MPIRVKIADRAAELSSLFQARHKVFVEEESYLQKTPDGRIFDRFDTYPTTANLIAMVDKEVVGGLRLTEGSAAGTPADDFFDFSPYLPHGEERIGTASMFCMQRAFRNKPRLTYMLICMGVYWSISKGFSHVVAAVNPLIEPMLRAIGFRPVKPSFHDEKHAVDVLPMLCDLNQVEDQFKEMAKFQGFYGSLRTFEREFYRSGEQIFCCDETGDSAYVVVDGTVSVSRLGRRFDDPPVKRVISEFGPGEIFGEISLLTSKPRSADVFAVTDVDLMVIERPVFHEQLLGNPNLQRKLLELLGQRLATAYERISDASSVEGAARRTTDVQPRSSEDHSSVF